MKKRKGKHVVSIGEGIDENSADDSQFALHAELEDEVEKKRFSKDFRSSSTLTEAKLQITSQTTLKKKVKMRTILIRAVNRKVSMILTVTASAAHIN